MEIERKYLIKKLPGRSGTISAYGDGTGVPLHGTGGAGEKRRRGLCVDYKSKGLMVGKNIICH